MTDKIFRIQSIEKIGNRVEAEILHEGKTSTIFFECDDPALVPSPEALLAVTLMPAMRAGAELQMGSEISKRILDSITTLQDIHHTWYPDIFQHIPVTEATPVERLNPEAQRVGLFFSLGVDSWYTLLKHRDTITDLIFVWGVDIFFGQTSLFEEAKRNLKIVANAFQKNLVIVKTNMTEFTELYTPYHHIFGSALSGIGHLLSGGLKTVYISAHLTYKNLIEAGSHALVDPLWSSESLQVIHEGEAATRLEKRTRNIAIIAVLLVAVVGYFLLPGLDDLTGGLMAQRYSDLDTTGRVDIVTVNGSNFVAGSTFRLYGVY